MHKLDSFTQKYYFALLFILVGSIRLVYAPLISGDVYIWLASGLKMLSTGALDTVDTFSIHSGISILYPSAFSSLIYALAFKLGGHAMIFIVTRFMGVFFLYVLYKKYLQYAPQNIFNLFIGFLSFSGAFFMLDRPAYLICIPAILAFDVLLSSKDEVPSAQYFKYYFLVLLWTNLHPSSLILLPFVGIRFFSKRTMSYFIFVLVTLLGVISNPIGFKIFEYALSTMHVSKERFVHEWGSVFTFPEKYLLLLFTALTCLMLHRVYKKGQIKEFFMSGLFLFFALALSSARHVVLFSVMILPTMYYLNLWKEEENIQQNLKHQKIILSALLITIACLLSINVFSFKLRDDDIQMDLVDYLRTKSDLRIFNNADGGFLSVYLNDKNSKIFFDNRNIIFSQDIYNDFYQMLIGQSVSQIEKKYNLNTIVVARSNSFLMNAIKDDVSWEKSFEGKASVVYLKRAQ